MKFLVYKTNFITSYKIYEIIQSFEEIFYNFSISCELMYSLNYTNNKLLVCFVENELTALLTAYFFDPEDGLSLKIKSSSNVTCPLVNFIISDLNPNNQISLICYVSERNNIFYCLLYDSKYNIYGVKEFN